MSETDTKNPDTAPAKKDKAPEAKKEQKPKAEPVPIAEAIDTSSPININAMSAKELRALSEKASEMALYKQESAIADAFDHFAYLCYTNGLAMRDMIKRFYPEFNFDEDKPEPRRIEFRSLDSATESWTGKGRTPHWFANAEAEGVKREAMMVPRFKDENLELPL